MQHWVSRVPPNKPLQPTSGAAAWVDLKLG